MEVNVEKWMFTFMQYLKHPDTGEELYSEDKVIKALEKKFIKRMGLRYPR